MSDEVAHAALRIELPRRWNRHFRQTKALGQRRTSIHDTSSSNDMQPPGNEKSCKC